MDEEKALLTQLFTQGNATDYDVERLEIVLDELERLGRIHRAEHDVLYFAISYFSEDGNVINSDNLIPSGVTYANTAHFHKQLCGLLDGIVSGKVTSHVAWACPRGHAKTAYLSNIFLVHQLVFRHKRYIVEISETTDVAGDFITWGRYQLKLNEKLREDFGELLDVRPSKNEVDNKYEFITKSGAKVEAKGLGTQMRGLRHGNTRPDLFILDDLESKDSTNTSELIEKSKRWFREEMLPALSRDGMCVYLGTILCHDSLLDYVIKERRDFQSRKFAAIETFASREDLWNQWRKIYRGDKKDAGEQAENFFIENREEMLKGIEILWADYWDYYKLMVIKEESGPKAFNQEYQNEPTDEERQIFKPEQIHYFTDDELKGKRIRYYGAIDIGMGKAKGDYSVIVTIAKNEDTGVCYIHDVFMERCHPDVLIKKATELTLKYQYERLGVEAQFAQEFISDTLAKELNARGYPSHTRIKQIKQRTRKALRIEALLPDIQNGKIRFRKKQTNELDQFFMYPMHKHDDFPDAVSMAYSTCRGKSAVVKTSMKRTR